jgi:hypothetical protein
MDSVNSFATLAEKITILNKNCVEILTKVNDIVSSEQDSVNILYNNNGTLDSYSQPTVGYLKNQIDTLNQNMKRMASIDGFTYVRDGQSYKRIMTSDLNREPAPIGTITQVKTFTPINNHFFESLMNPMLAVTVDLTDKVEQVVNKILSRRYIVRFEANPDSSLTEAGIRSYNSFYDTFLGRTDINISDFIAWYENSSNDGLVVDSVKPYDEQIYDVSLKNLNYYGVFSVIKVEIDDINNKMWYHLNTLKFYGNDSTVKTLTIGDELIINKLNSSSRYKIKEVNTDSSNNKIRLELVEGYDPVTVGTNVLKYYSDISSQKSVNINVGFNEYIVLFIKPINIENNIVGSLWSKGISFYTNDLVLDINNNINLSNYYVEAVYDYGTMLKDMLSKTIPSIYGVTPNPVVLTQENFKVVQINKHLTDEKDQNTLMKTHAEKASTKTTISQIKTAIQQKTSKLNSGGLTSTEKQTYLSEINKLKTDLNIATNNLSSLITQLTELNTGSNAKVEPKFRVRGFWAIPEPILTDKTQPQHVIQFRMQYRYSSKSGNSNNIQTFNYVNTQQTLSTASSGGVRIQVDSKTGTLTGGGVTTSTSVQNKAYTGGSSIAVLAPNTNQVQVTGSSMVIDYPTKTQNVGKTVSITSTDVATTTENPTDGPKYANFTNWVEIISNIRKRYWDEYTSQWYYKIEDVSDAEMNNINQADIPISENERVEMRIKSISEVGWPDSLIESDWSNVLTIDFPDELSTTADNALIIGEAAEDKTSVALEKTLSSVGIIRHVEDSFTVNQDYVAHRDTSIQVSLKTDASSTMNLFQYLTYLTDRVAALEQLIAGSSGTLNAILYKNTKLVSSIKNNTTTTIVIECEDYSTKVTDTNRTYENNIYLIDDYIISFENTNQSGNLGFLSNRSYTMGGTNSFYSTNGGNNKVLLIDSDNDLYIQRDNQYMWFSDKDNNEWISSGVTSLTKPVDIMNTTSKNLGTTGTTTGVTWNVKDIFVSGSTTDLLCVAFPYLPDIDNFRETGQDKTKIIKAQTKINIGTKLFFKLDGSINTNSVTTPTTYTPGNGSTNVTKSRKIKFWFEMSNNVNFQFVIIFNFRRQRNFMKPKTDVIDTEATQSGGNSKYLNN